MRKRMSTSGTRLREKKERGRRASTVRTRFTRDDRLRRSGNRDRRKVKAGRHRQ
jgi:hypothetical protein